MRCAGGQGATRQARVAAAGAGRHHDPKQDHPHRLKTKLVDRKGRKVSTRESWGFGAQRWAALLVLRHRRRACLEPRARLFWFADTEATEIEKKATALCCAAGDSVLFWNRVRLTNRARAREAFATAIAHAREVPSRTRAREQFAERIAHARETGTPPAREQKGLPKVRPPCTAALLLVTDHHLVDHLALVSKALVSSVVSNPKGSTQSRVRKQVRTENPVLHGRQGAQQGSG